MAKLVRLGEFRRKKREINLEEEEDFNEIFKKARMILTEGQQRFRKNLGEIELLENSEEFFRNEIIKKIFEESLFEKEIIFCGIYVAKLLANFSSSTPSSFWAIDYFYRYNQEEKILEKLTIAKEGGDFCFLVCSLFPQLARRRLVSIRYYQELGKSFYYQFFVYSKKIVGYYMSLRFNQITKIVNSIF